MPKNKRKFPSNVHFLLALFSVGAIFLFLFSQYLNNNLDFSSNYINYVVVGLLFLVALFHIFEGVKNDKK